MSDIVVFTYSFATSLTSGSCEIAKSMSFIYNKLQLSAPIHNCLYITL